MCCNQKEKVRNHTAHSLPSRPQVSMFSWSISHNSNLRSSSPINCLLTLSDAHYKIKDVQVFYFHKTTEQISQHPSPASPIHTNASKGNSLITDYIHYPKAQAWFPPAVHKTPDSLVSLESLCSSLTNYQAQRKVLAFSQAFLANRASHRYVYKDPLFCLPNLSKNPHIILPKLHSLPKSDLLIFLSSWLPIHHSHSTHHRHTHSTFLSKKSSHSSLFQSLKISHQTSVSFFLKPPKSSHSILSNSHRLPPLLAPLHQFSSIPPHYFQPPIFLNHWAHTNKDQATHATPCNSNGALQ
jgi:hypothetical protein